MPSSTTQPAPSAQPRVISVTLGARGGSGPAGGCRSPHGGQVIISVYPPEAAIATARQRLPEVAVGSLNYGGCATCVFHIGMCQLASLGIVCRYVEYVSIYRGNHDGKLLRRLSNTFTKSIIERAFTVHSTKDAQLVKRILKRTRILCVPPP